MTQAQRLAGRSTTALAVVALIVFGVVVQGTPYALARELWAIRATGYAALTALFLSLSVTPAFHLARRLAPGPVPRSSFLAWRRSFGIASASFALLHTGLTLATYLWGSWSSVLVKPYLRAGMVTATILTVLLATSFPALLARLRVRLWNELHRLAYVAAFFLAQHLLMSPFAPRRLTWTLFGALVAVGLLRWLPPRPKRA